jgi:hypothetical protein
VEKGHGLRLELRAMLHSVGDIRYHICNGVVVLASDMRSQRPCLWTRKIEALFTLDSKTPSSLRASDSLCWSSGLFQRRGAAPSAQRTDEVAILFTIGRHKNETKVRSIVCWRS